MAALASSLSAVEVRVRAQAPACVLDASLALAPGGLLLAIRLAREWPVWLVRSMWPLIDSNGLFRDQPARLARQGEPDAGIAALVGALGDWHDAWQRDKIRNIHWPGDYRHESDFPEDSEEGLLGRFDLLADRLIATLEGTEAAAIPLPAEGGRAGGEAADAGAGRGWSWRDSCGCEALALAAALQTRPTLILAAASSADGARDDPPHVVRLWQRWTGTTVAPLPVGAVPALALPPLLGIGMPPLLTGALRLAAVHVVAPRALTLGPDDDGEENDDGPPADPWEGAMLSWHPLS